jgi:hypothetical protein
MTEAVSPLEKAIATEVLQRPGTPVEIRPNDAGIVIGDHRSFWRRVYDSWTCKLQAVAGVIFAVWLAIPQDTMLAVVPQKYAAAGMLVYCILTALVRMRNL